MNTTDTQFTKEEINFLSKVLKYYLYFRQKILLETLALEAETALKKLNTIEQKHFKNAVFRDVAPCISCVNRRFRGTYRLHLQSRKIR
jgi:hypothetical protein